MEDLTMRNVIGGKYNIDQNNWVLSLVRNPMTDHGFLVIEGVDSDGARIIREAHLGHKKIDDFTNDPTKCGIYYLPGPIEKLQKIHASFQYKSWPVSFEDVENILLPKIFSDMEKANSEEGIDYVKFTTTNGGLPGIIGGTLDTFYLTGVKEAAMRKTHASSAEGGTVMAGISHDSVISSLNNHPNKANCSSWAIKTARAIPSVKECFEESMWAKYVILIPSNEFKDRKLACNIL